MKDEQKEVHTIPDKAMQHAAKTSLQKATRWPTQRTKLSTVQRVVHIQAYTENTRIKFISKIRV